MNIIKSWWKFRVIFFISMRVSIKYGLCERKIKIWTFAKYVQQRFWSINTFEDIYNEKREVFSSYLLKQISQVSLLNFKKYFLISEMENPTWENDRNYWRLLLLSLYVIDQTSSYFLVTDVKSLSEAFSVWKVGYFNLEKMLKNEKIDFNSHKLKLRYRLDENVILNFNKRISFHVNF